MSDEALIRLSNLKAMDLSPSQLSERVGGRYTYWRDLLAGNKSFGEKVARKIEEALALPRGQLDVSGADTREDPPAWPLKTLSYAEFVSLPEQFHTAVENFAQPYVKSSQTLMRVGDDRQENVSTREQKRYVFVDHETRKESNGPGHSNPNERTKPAPRKSAGDR